MATYHVDSYHINVGAGDGSIHIFYEFDPGTWKRTVVKALIIDGGKANDEVKDKFKRTILDIERKYECQGTKNNQFGRPMLLFDGYIITHWDADHHEGVVALLQDDVISIDGNLKNLRLRRALYHPQGLPLSFFFAPHFTEKQHSGVGDVGKVKKLDDTLRLDEKQEYLDIKYKKTGEFAERMLKARVKTTDLLGRNFFDGGDNQLNGNGAGSIDSIETLLSVNKPYNPYPDRLPQATVPGMYCVAVNQFVLGQASIQTTPTNKSSICCLVIWGNGHCSHYLAGDADSDYEEEIEKWTRQNGNARQITSMKLSHHGAKTSTPDILLRHFDPRNIIVSAGGGGYGHPRWELIVLIDAWYESKTSTGRLNPGKPLFITQWPSYIFQNDELKWVTEKTGRWTANIGKDLEKRYKAFKDLTNGARVSFTAVQSADIIAERQAEKINTPRLERLFIIERLVPALARLSHTAMETTNLGPGAYLREKLVDLNEQLVWTRVECSSLPDSDGRVRVGFKNRKSQAYLNEWKFPIRLARKIAKAIAKARGLTPQIQSTNPNFGQQQQILARSRSSSWSSINYDEWLEISPQNSTFMSMHESALDDDNPPVGIVLPGGSVVKLPSESPIYRLIDCLIPKQIFVTAQPTANVANSLTNDDDWVQWFKIFHRNWKSPKEQDTNCHIAMTMSVWPPIADTLPQFNVEFDFNESKRLQMSTAIAATSHVFLDFDGNAQKKMLHDEVTIAFGMPPETESFETTIRVISDFVGFNDGKFPGLMVLGAIPANLDVGKGSRNAMWFQPGRDYLTTIRLQFLFHPTVINNWLKQAVSDVEVTEAKVIAKKEGTWLLGREADYGVMSGEITFSMSLALKSHKFTTTATISDDSVTLKLICDRSEKNVLETILSWLVEKLSMDSAGVTDWLKNTTFVKSFALQKLELNLNMDSQGQLTSITSFTMSIEVSLMIGKSDQTKPLLSIFSLSWAKDVGVSFMGSLWCKRPASPYDIYLKATPGWEQHNTLVPITVGDEARLGVLDLRNLLPEGVVENIPSGIPTQVTEAVIEIDAEHIAFRGSLQCSEPKEANSNPVPRLILDMVTLSARYNWKNADRGLRLGLDVDFLLFRGGHSPEEDDDVETMEPARLYGNLIYDNGLWMFSAGIQQLTISHIASFFSQKQVLPLLEKLTIDYLNLEYHYTKEADGTAKCFTFDGKMSFGALQLGITYEHKGGDKWFFKAAVGADSQNTGSATVKDILKSIMDDVPKDLPPAIGEVSIRKPGSDDELFRIECHEEEGLIFFIMTIKIGSITLSFMQYRETSWGKERSSKRLLKAGISEISGVNVPLVGNITQPFEQLYYLWVQDDYQGQGKDSLRGVSKAEFDKIGKNSKLSPTDQLWYKAVKKYNDLDVVITAGSHFFVIAKDANNQLNVVLDYAFLKPRASKLSIADPGESDTKEKAVYKRSVGPLSVENIGLYYKNKQIGIMLDATFLLGPIGLSLLGFSIDVPFDEKHNLSNPPRASDIGFSLKGLIVAFDRPPLRIAGGFMHTTLDGNDCYAGGLVVDFQPWSFIAAGVYAEVQRPVTTYENTYTMVFIFCKLEGPLFSLGYADISGLIGGFGMNSDITIPTVEQVMNFPFVKSEGDANAPLQTLQSLMKPSSGDVWFRPSEGSFWVAAGLKVTAFQLLKIDAVLIVQFNPEVKIAICGIANAEFPSKAKTKFARVELGIVCVFDIGAGFFKAEAQLTPRSFIIDPNCHLTGGFALYSWTKSRQNAVAGDWVFTIGGYHQAFSVPVQYPRVPRLGVSWQLGPISILGEAYFAITPKVCMGGGRLHASLTKGLLYAWFDVFVDFLVNFEPFFFNFTAAVSVGVRFSMKILFVTVRISCEIGATLLMSGPPVSGVVWVNFWVFGFPIPFGSKGDRPGALELGDFIKLVLKSGSNNALTTADVTKAHLITCENGLEPPPQADRASTENEEWVVRGGDFSFMVTFKFAINKGTMKDTREGLGRDDLTIKIPPDQLNIYARPMQLNDTMESDATIVVHAKAQNVTLRYVTEDELHMASAERKTWLVEPITSWVDTSIWGKCKSFLGCRVELTFADYRDMDPIHQGNSAEKLLRSDNVSIPLVTGVKISPPDPHMAEDTLAKFNVVDDMKESVFEQEAQPKFPLQVASNPAFRPKEKHSKLEDVKNAWINPVNQPERVAVLWAKKLGFADGAVSGRRPQSYLKRFSSLVPASPMIAVG